MFAEIKRWQSEKYLKWVRSLPCCLCGDNRDIQAHHMIGTGHGGMGTKAPDYLAMPLCPECHSKMHQSPRYWAEQQGLVLGTLSLAFDDGIIQ